MPQASFKIEGNIVDFTRIDNLYTSMKSEGEKFLKEWKIEFNVVYSETQGQIPEKT